MPMGQLGSQLMGRMRQRQPGQQQPYGGAQGVPQQPGGDQRRAAMMQMLQQRMGQRQGQQATGGQQQGLLGRMLAARGQRPGMGRMGGQVGAIPGGPRQALMRRRMGQMAGNRQMLQQRLAAK